MTTLSAHGKGVEDSIGQLQTKPVDLSSDFPASIKATVTQHVVEAPETPELHSPAEILPPVDEMTGKKIVPLERPDDNARHLASLLTLEEKVWLFAEQLNADADE